MKKKPEQLASSAKPKLIIEPLSPRVLYSADPLGLSGDLVLPEDSTEFNDEYGIVLEHNSENNFDAVSKRTHIVFVDTSVQGYREIIDSLSADNSEEIELIIYRLEATDSLEQITEEIQNHSNVAAMHFITHGSDAELQLGAATITSDTLSSHNNNLNQWKKVLTEDGDILFYGCNVAESQEGKELIVQIAKATDADVAASDDLTGHSSYSGDWELEFATGNTEYANLHIGSQLEDWRSLLNTNVITVDEGNDDITPNNNTTTLREAIIQANASSVPMTILLGDTYYNINITSVHDNSSADEEVGDFDITNSVTIEGSSLGNSTIAAGNKDRIFEIVDAGDVTLKNITISQGHATNTTQNNLGGGLYVEGTNLTLDNVTLENSKSDGQAGGAILVGSDSVVNIKDSNIKSSSTTQYGGGMYVVTGSEVTISNTTFENNSTAEQSIQNGGGAIFNDGTLHISGTSFTQNHSTHGSGIYSNQISSVTNIYSSDFSNNHPNNFSLTTAGGAIYNEGTLNAYDTTINGNRASLGGGIYNAGTTTTFGSSLENNIADDYNNAGIGGAIFNNQYFNTYNTVFDNNFSVEQGGAINNIGEVKNHAATFTNNQSKLGGAITSLGPLYSTDTEFSLNVASKDGGAIYLQDTSGTLERNLIHNNSAEFGAGVHSNSSTVNISDSVLSHNDATTYGAGVDARNNSIVNIERSSITFNKASNYSALHDTRSLAGISDSTIITYRSSIITGNSGSNPIDDHAVDDGNNLTVPPNQIGLSGTPGLSTVLPANSYQIPSGSIAIVDTTTTSTNNTDITGAKRINDDDIGAYEYRDADPLEPPVIIVNKPDFYTNENSTKRITPLFLSTQDLDTPDTNLEYNVVTAPASGYLELLNASGQPITKFTQDDLNSGRLAYTNTGYVAPQDSFKFNVTDGTHVTNDTTFIINLNDPANESPVFSDIDRTNYYVAGDDAVILDANGRVNDPELDLRNGGSGDYSGSTLTLNRDTGANSDDLFSLQPDNGITISGTDLLRNGFKIGTWTTPVAGQLEIKFDTFNNNPTSDDIPTSTDVNNIISHITYANNSNSVSEVINLEWTFSDGNTGDSDQGTGGVLIDNDTSKIYFFNSPEVSLTGPTSISTNEDNSVNLTAPDIVIDDNQASNNSMQARLHVVNGTLSLSGTNNINVVEGADGESSFVLEGTKDDINVAIADLQYTPNQDYNGNDDNLIIDAGYFADLNAHYHFSDGTDDTSAGGTQNNGVLINNASLVPDPDVDTEKGQVLQVDNGQALEIASDLGVSDNLTISAWVNLTSQNANGSDLISLGDDVVIRLDKPDANGDLWLQAIYKDDAGEKVTEKKKNLFNKGWQHIVYTVDSDNNTQRLYLNGVEETVNNYNPLQPIAYDGTPNTIGKNAVNNNHDLQGYVDDVRIYSRALSAAEIESIFIETDSASVSIPIDVIPVNDQPSIVSTSVDDITTTENANPVALLPNIDLSDVEDKLTNATVTFASGYVQDHDVLAYNNTGSNITGLFDPAAGTLTLNAINNATVSEFEQALQSITYENLSDNPASATRAVEITLTDDGNLISNTASLSIDVTSINDAPKLSNIESGKAYYIENNEGPPNNGQSTGITGNLTLADPDSTIASATIDIKDVNGTLHAEDTLYFVPDSTITGSISATFANGTLTLVGPATPEQMQSAIRMVQYTNNSEDPSTIIRVVNISVDDGETNNSVSNTLSRNIEILPVNDAPLATASEITIDEDESYTFLLSDFGFEDPQDNHNHASVIALNTQNNPRISQDASGVVTYTPQLNNTSTDTFQFHVTDDGGTVRGGVDTSALPATMTVNFNAINDNPAITSTNTDLAFRENDNPLAIFSDITVSDVDTDISSATIKITGNFMSEDSLTFDAAAAPSGISASFNNTGDTLVLTGPATTADFQAAIRLVNYNNASDTPSDATRTIEVFVDDGQINNNRSQTLSHSITVIPVNDAPTAFDSSVTINEDSTKTFSTADFVFSDTENHSISITLANNDNPNVSVNASGDIVYTAANNNTATDTFEFIVTDNGGTANGGVDTSAAATMTVDFIPINDSPIVTSNNTDLVFRENDNSLAIFSDITVSDVDTDISSATIKITGNFMPEDSLTFDAAAAPSGISASLSNTGDTLVLTGPATTADFQAAIRLVNYNNTSNTPSDATRTIEVFVDDGQANNNRSQTLSHSITVIPVNDAPTALDSSVRINEDSTKTFSTADFVFSDTENHSISITPANNDNPNVSVNASGDIVYTAANNNTATDTFEFIVTDNGGTANGGVDTSAPATMTVDFIPVNDAPSIANTNLTPLSEDTSSDGQTISSLFTNDFQDADNHTLAGVAITANNANSNNEGTWEYSVTPGNWNPIVIPTNGEALLLGTGTSIRFEPVSDFNGTPGNLTLRAVDSSYIGNFTDSNSTSEHTALLPLPNDISTSAFSTSDSTLGIIVTPVNDAPSSSNANLTQQFEDGRAPETDQVSSLFAYEDIDGTNQLYGIAITHNPQDATQGVWRYSDDGGNWKNVNRVSDVNPLVIKSSSYIKFDSAPHFNGAVAPLEAYVIDGAYQPATAYVDNVRNTIDTTAAGTWISADKYTVSAHVTSVNDAPSASGSIISVLEDQQFTFAVADFGYSDIDQNAFNAIEIISLPTSGTLVNQGNAVNVGDIIAVTDISANNFIYTPAANQNGTGLAAWEFAAIDDGGTDNNGDNKQLNAATISIDVTPVNDAPEGTDNNINVIEGTPTVLSVADFGITDLENNALLDVVVENVPQHGTLLLGTQPVATGAVLSALDFNTGSVSYSVPVDSGINNSTLVFTVRDNGGTNNGGQDTATASNVITFNIAPPPNNEPLSENKTISLLEDSEYVFTDNDFHFTDRDNHHSLESVLIETLPINGTLYLYDIKLVTPVEIAASSISNGELTYKPDTDQAGIDNSSFEFRVRDDGPTSGGGSNLSESTYTIQLDVQSVNDAPVAKDKMLQVTEATAYTLKTTDFGFEDPTDQPNPNKFAGVFIESAPTKGTLTLNQMDVLAQDFIPASAIANGDFLYTPSEVASTEQDTLTFKVLDTGGTANNGVNESSIKELTFNIAVSNNPPSGVNAVVTLNEDNSVLLTETAFGFNDIDGHKFAGIIVTALPSDGTLYLNNTELQLTQQQLYISAADMAAGKLVFRPAANSHADDYASMEYHVVDTGNNILDKNLATESNILTFSVLSVNDSPVNLAVIGNKQLTENTESEIIGGVTFDDIDLYDTDSAEFHVVSVVNDDRFQVINNELSLKDGVTIDYESEQAIALTLKVVDRAGLEATHDLTIDVLNINEPLVVDQGIDDVTIKISSSPRIFSIPEDAFFDVDNASLTYTATLENELPLPEWIIFDPNTATFSITNIDGSEPPATVVVTANDGEFSQSTSFIVTAEPALLEAQSFTINTPMTSTAEVIDSESIVAPQEEEETVPQPDAQEETNQNIAEDQFAAPQVAFAQILTDNDDALREVVQIKSEKSTTLKVVQHRDNLIVATNSDDKNQLQTTEFTLKQIKQQNAYVAMTLNNLAKQVNQNQTEIKNAEELETKVLATSVTLSSSLSVGYILWLLRGGTLLASMMASMPAWRAIDPLPVLDGLSGDDEDDTETLESMVEDTEDSDHTDHPDTHLKRA